MMTSHGIGRALRFTALLVPLLVTPIASCSRDQLLSVPTPDQIVPSAIASSSGAQALRVSAIGNFVRFYAADAGGSGIALNLTVAIFTDEAFAARSGTEHLDSRAQINANFPANAPWSPFGTAFNQIVRATRALNKYPPSPASVLNTQLGQLYMLKGFIYTMMAETYCSGIPFSTVNDDKPSSVNLTTADMYAAAQVAYDSALTLLSTSNGDQQYRLAARIGKARTYVDVGQYDKAAAVVGAGGDGAGSSAVPTSFVYNAEMSKLTTGIVNDVYDWMLATKNFGASDKEGGNGLDFVSSKDPRIKVDGTKIGPGQDGTPTPLMNQFTTTDAPVAVATGVEARLIEAENYLKNGDVTNYLASLNTPRASFTGGTLAPLTDPGDATSRVNQLFRERAFWMYMTGHRLGDMRRLIRQYGRAVNSVVPTGSYLHGGAYGTDVVLYPAQSETNNPNWMAPAGRTEACADKSP